MLTEQGRIETEVTVTRMSEELFYVVSCPVGHVCDLENAELLG